MTDIKLGRASRNVLEKLRAGKRMSNDTNGYHWRHHGSQGRVIADDIVDPLFAAGLVENVDEVSPKYHIRTTWVKLREC